MSNEKLARKARRQARRARRRGDITGQMYTHIVKATNDPVVLDEWNYRIEQAGLNPWANKTQLMGFSWEEIWNWFEANWPKILEILLAILPLLVLEEKNE